MDHGKGKKTTADLAIFCVAYWNINIMYPETGRIGMRDTSSGINLYAAR